MNNVIKCKECGIDNTTGKSSFFKLTGASGFECDECYHRRLRKVESTSSESSKDPEEELGVPKPPSIGPLPTPRNHKKEPIEKRRRRSSEIHTDGPNNVAFCKWVSNRVYESGLSQQVFAFRAGIHSTSLSSVMRNTRGVGSKVCRKLGDMYGVREEVLISFARNHAYTKLDDVDMTIKTSPGEAEITRSDPWGRPWDRNIPRAEPQYTPLQKGPRYAEMGPSKLVIAGDWPPFSKRPTPPPSHTIRGDNYDEVGAALTVELKRIEDSFKNIRALITGYLNRERS